MRESISLLPRLRQVSLQDNSKRMSMDEGLKKCWMKDSKSAKIQHDEGIRPNVLEAHGSRKLDQCEEKSVTIKAQCQMCPRCELGKLDPHKEKSATMEA